MAKYFKALVWPGFEFDLIGTDACYILGIYTEAKPLAESIMLANGQELQAGDVITQLGGEKTSAGFSTIWFDDDKGLLYEGKLIGLDGEFLCFNQLRNRKRVVPSSNKYRRMYFAFIDSKLPSREWIFTNQAGSGRLVETTNVKLRKEPYHDI